jgi:RNA methyltransferase, TrmH family
MISKNQIKAVKALHRKKERDEQKTFLAEGVKAVVELLNSENANVKELFAVADFMREYADLLRKKKIPIYEVSEGELAQISTQKAPNRVLALVEFFAPSSADYSFQNNFSFFLDDIRDPGNLGTIIRLADWYGIPKIFCSHQTVDLYNPKVIQSTMGAFLRVEVAYRNLQELISVNNIKSVYGAVLNGKNIYTESLSPGLIVIGNESLGISQDNLSLVNKPITIPANSKNGTESLNAAIATAIICSEFFRNLSVR